MKKIGGEYYSGDDAWEYLKSSTGIDFKKPDGKYGVNKLKENNVIQGDCLDILGEIEENKADMIYLDPPFFTQEKQKLVSSKTNKEYIFNDTWNSMDEYLSYMEVRLIQCRRVLKKTGSIFVHCDRNASHYLKVLLDKIFGSSNFQSEIIWSYKRWSNSKKGLLNNHQVILFYSKTSNFKFNRIYTDYSETTNIDQILQERVRNEKGKAVYKYNADGDIVTDKVKREFLYLMYGRFLI
mgnify:CR=1 FL=1